jgi:hypothetical protein
MSESQDLVKQSGETLRIGDQLIRFDREQTVEAYKQIAQSWAERCKCVACRNFLAQRNTAFPGSFLNLLNHLGIDSSKEGEIFGCILMPSGKRHYGGWFFFSGILLQSGELRQSEDGIDYFVIGPGRMPRPSPRDAFGPNPLALDFTIEIPWVLLNEDPDEAYRPAAKKEPGANK